MVGRFGLNDDHCHDRAPLERMVEARPSCCVFRLAAAGLLTPGITATISDGGGHGDYLVSGCDSGKIELDGQPIRLAAHKVLPARVFVCGCGREAYRMHRVDGVWKCRICHRLTYMSRHRWRTIPGLIRLRYLRRRIGADPTPFSALPVKPLYARKHWAIAREIRLLESALIAHGRDEVALVLEKRHGRS